MPIHSIFITDISKNVIYNHVFSPQCSANFSLQLRELARLDLLVGKSTFTMSEKISGMVEDVIIVAQKYMDMIIFLCGTEEIDEILRKVIFSLSSLLKS